MRLSMPEIEVFPDSHALARAAAWYFTILAQSAIARQGQFSVALAGGSTPKALYELLAQPPFVEQIDWSRVQVFWGDERCVPPEHPDSDYGMAYRALLGPLALPASQVHRLRGEIDPAQAALDYEIELRVHFAGQAWPRFDLVLLGMGEDGHTASLFPGSPALGEQQRWVLAVEHTTPPPPLVTRLTLTLPALNAAAEIIFMVTGANKQARLAQALGGLAGDLPAQRIQPVDGRLRWLVDRDAAG